MKWLHKGLRPHRLLAGDIAEIPSQYRKHECDEGRTGATSLESDISLRNSWAMAPWRKNAERFILFISGVILSALASAIFGNVLKLSEALLIALVVLALLGATFFFATSTQRIEALAERMDTTVVYVEELYREQEGIPFKGIVYRELEKLLSEAQMEILVLTTTFQKGKVYTTVEHPARVQMLHASEETMKSRAGSGFKYVYIAQIPPEGKDFPLIQYLGTATVEHWRRILELERRSPAPKLDLSLMTIPTQRLNDIILIDRRHTVLIMDGLDSAGDPYAAGIFFLEDRGGRLVERLLWYFSQLERLAKPVTLADLHATS